MTDNSTTTINDPDHFRETLTGLHDSLTAKPADVSKLTTAVTDAAGKGVVAAEGGSTGEAGPVAPAYTAVSTALSSAVDDIKGQAGAAAGSVQTVIADLTALLTGLTNIDADAAGAVTAV
jgi:hypothetical protein